MYVNGLVNLSRLNDQWCMWMVWFTCHV